MVKDNNLKKKKIKQQNISFDSLFRRTIRSDIMVVLLLVTFVITSIMFAYFVNTLNFMAKTNTTNIISGLKIFNVQDENTFRQGLPHLRESINNLVSEEYKVKDILVVNKKNNKVIFTTMNPAKGYSYNYNLGNFRPIELKKAPYDVSSVNIISISKIYGKESYTIYLLISQNANSYINNAISFFGKFFLLMLFLAFISVFYLSRGITKPLETIEETVSKIAKGDLSGRLDFTKYYEINKLVMSYNIMVNSLQRLYSSLEVQVQDKTKELRKAYDELQNTQAMMVHSEKMKSLGELVAGIMHEINNPINFIYGNMTHLSNYSNDLIQIIEEYDKYNTSLKAEEKESVENLKQEIDYEFLKTDMPDLIRSCKEGADRAKNIIQDLKSFSRMEETNITDVDLPKEIDMTLNILHNKIKNKAEVHKEYIENVPKIEAFGGQLNQVFMNIIDNAVGAIDKEKGDIWIRINKDSEDKNVVIEIEDNGTGMSEETARKIFDPFFTTKQVGQGTGLGLSITHKIIKNHQGTIAVQSKVGTGTKFIITLPINIDREKLNSSLDSGEANG